MAESTYTDKDVDRIRNIHHGNFLDYLSSAYEVLRKIFSYLSLEDLENVSKAIERWRPIVETTKKERTLIESFVLTYKCEECHTWSEASFCITFCMEENKVVKQKLRKHLREDAQFVFVESRSGVIGTTRDLTQVVQQKIMRFSTPPMNTALATHLRIPHLPGVHIKVLEWNRSISFTDFRESFNLPENSTIKCLLILTTYQGTSREASEQKDDFVLFLQATQDEGFAVGGCLIDAFLNDSEQEIVTKYIIFYGDKVDAASTVLKQDVKTKQRIEAKVEELKSICPKFEQGVLFVFRCCSRNKVMRQPKLRKDLAKWEGDALMKYFPGTPIVGCYGYGEFGRKFPNECAKCLNKRTRQCDIWEYSFSTSVVFVGFKK